MTPIAEYVRALRAEVQHLTLGAAFDLPLGLFLQGPLAAITFTSAPVPAGGSELRFQIRPAAPRAGESPRLARAAEAMEARGQDSTALRRRLGLPPVSDEDLAGLRLTLDLVAPGLEPTTLSARTEPGGAAVFGWVPGGGRCRVTVADFGEAPVPLGDRLADPRPEVQRLALDEVRRAGLTTVMMDGVTGLLHRGADDGVRLAALETLAGARQGADAADGLLGGSAPDGVKAAALAALARAGRLTAEGPWIGWALARLGAADAAVRRAAVEALGSARASARPDVFPGILGRLDDPDAGVRSAAASAVAASGPAALPDLAARLLDPNPTLRRVAAATVGQAGLRREAAPIDSLIRLLADEDSAVVRASLEALSRVPGGIPSDQLGSVLDLCRHPDRGVRAAAAQVAGQLTRSWTAPPPSGLSALLRDDDRGVRSAARRSLAAVLREPLLNGPFPLPFAGRFEILRVLGQGGMATAFMARRTDGGEVVALKVPLPAMEDHEEGRWRFREEARIGTRLCHPNCCPVLEYVERGPGEERSYLVLPFMAGGSLEQRLDRGGPVLAAVAGFVGLRLAEALAHAHAHGHIHNDLKPSNVLFASAVSDEPVLSDFGVALDLADPEARLPGWGDLIGTPVYMAPELIEPPGHDPISPRADVWALGVVLHQLLTGRHPFHGLAPDPAVRERLGRRLSRHPASVVDVMAAAVSVAPPAPSALAPGVPAALDEACRRALQKNPRERPTGGEMADRLRAFLAGEAPAPPPGPVAEGDIRIGFVPYREPAPGVVRDAVYLDVGGAVRAGVIDRRHLHHYPGSTAAMLPSRLDLIDAAVRPDRRPGDPFTLRLHQEPDFDSLAAAYLARAHLTRRRLPPGAAALCAYADRVNAGHPGFTLAQPFTPYTAFLTLLDRASRDEAGWGEAVRQGFALLDHVLAGGPDDEAALLEVDAFAAPGLFTAPERAFLTDDRERYVRKLADPRCAARRATFWLVSHSQPRREPCLGLLVRHMNEGEPCRLVKDWARAEGYVPLCVYWEEGQGAAVSRAILSVTPDSGVSLRGLGALLEREEGRRRAEVHGADDRLTDGQGRRRANRPGFDHPDPWYDGRSHAYTIVAAPAGGTVLTAEEIEGLFLRFGQATDVGPV